MLYVSRLEVGDQDFVIFPPRSSHDEKPVDDGPHTAAAAREELGDAQSHLPQIESVYAQRADEQGDDERHGGTLVRVSRDSRELAVVEQAQLFADHRHRLRRKLVPVHEDELVDTVDVHRQDVYFGNRCVLGQIKRKDLSRTRDAGHFFQPHSLTAPQCGQRPRRLMRRPQRPQT